MGMPDEPYYTIIVETYRISGSGLHGEIHDRPVKGEQFPQSLHVRSLASPASAGSDGFCKTCGRRQSMRPWTD